MTLATSSLTESLVAPANAQYEQIVSSNLDGFTLSFGTSRSPRISRTTAVADMTRWLEGLTAVLSAGDVSVTPEDDGWKVVYSGLAAELDAASALSTADEDDVTVTERATAKAAHGHQFIISRDATNRLGGQFTLAVGAQETASLSFTATAAEIKAAITAQDSGLEVSLSGNGSAADPWVIDFDRAQDATHIHLQSAQVLRWIDGTAVEVDFFEGVEEVRINNVINLTENGGPEAGATHPVKLPSRALLFLNDGAEQTFVLNPTSVPSGSTYTIHVDGGTDTIDFKGYGSNRTLFGGFEENASGSEDNRQEIRFYASATDKTAAVSDPSMGPQPELTLVIVGLEAALGDTSADFTKALPLMADQHGTAATTFLLDAASLDSVSDEAVSRWLSATGNDPEYAAALDQISFVVSDLGGRTLAQAFGTTIRIDTNAAGNGWFVDPTLDSDVEFAIAGPSGSLLADTDSEAYAKYDLLTVAMHEIGHVLGLDDINVQSGMLMSGQLTAGTRAMISGQDASGISLNAIQTGDVSGAALSDQEKILGGLDAFADWAEELEDKISTSIKESFTVPFVDLGLKDLWDTTGGVITDSIVNGIRADIVGVFDGNDHVTTEDFLALDVISASPSNLLTEFQADLELTSTCWDVSVAGTAPTGSGCTPIEFSLDFLNGLGLDLTSFVDLTMSEPLRLEAALDLRFVFGLDSQTGEFFMEDPSLIARATLDHDEPLDVSLNVGPIGVGVVGGNVFFQAGIQLPTEGRFSAGDLSNLEVGTLRFDPQSSYEIDLPLKMQGALAGLGEDIGRLHGQFNRDANGALNRDDLTLVQFFTLIPETLNFEGGNFGAVRSQQCFAGCRT